MQSNIRSSIGYLISCNQTSDSISTVGKVGQVGMKITLPSSSNLALQGGEFLCDLIIPKAVTTSNNIATSTSAKVVIILGNKIQLLELEILQVAAILIEV